MEVTGQHHAQAALPRSSLKNRLYEIQSRCESIESENTLLLLQGFESRIVQPVA